MKRSESAGGIVINVDGNVLVVNQNGDSWSLPKGHIEDGETPLEAAIREIEEESGITKLDFVKELGFYERYKIGKGGRGEDTSELKKIHMFLFFTEEDLLNPKDPSNPEAKWLSPEEVAKALTHDKDREFFIEQIPSVV